MEDLKPFPKAEPTVAGSIGMMIVHGLFWTGLLVLPLFSIVPRFIKIFDDFGVTVPTVTRWIFMASVWVRAFWYVVPFLLMALLAVDGAVHFHLCQNPATRRMGRTWFALGALLPILAFLLSTVAIGVPMIALIDALSKK